MSISDGKTFVGKQGTAQVHADGSATLKSEVGTVEMDTDGTVKVSLGISITKVSIDNLLDLESHTITRGDRAVSHHVVYRERGEVRLSYRHTDGKILEFTSENTKTQFNVDGSVVISRADKNLPAQPGFDA